MGYKVEDVEQEPRARKYGLPDEVIKIVNDFLMSDKKEIFIVPDDDSRQEVASLQKRIAQRYQQLTAHISCIKGKGKVLLTKKAER